MTDAQRDAVAGEVLFILDLHSDPAAPRPSIVAAHEFAVKIAAFCASTSEADQRQALAAQVGEYLYFAPSFSPSEYRPSLLPSDAVGT